MKKALMVASVASMIDQFNMENIYILQSLGYEVDVVCNFDFGNTTSEKRVEEFKKELKQLGIYYINVLFPRKFGSMRQNIKIYKQCKKIVEAHKYDLIHCHSPIGGVIIRLACINRRKQGGKVIYTAHGFHFFKKGPLKNWIFYPIERFLAKFTDLLITINNEDYNRALTFHAKDVIKIPGIGVNISKYKGIHIDKCEKICEFNIPKESFIILSVGEVRTIKNHEVIIRAIARLKNDNIFYIICGNGPLQEYLKELCIKLEISKQVLIAGFRKDISEILQIADCFAFPSRREGLGIACIEAMAVGLPIITTNVNGIMEYSEDGKTGFVRGVDDINGFADAIMTLYEDSALRNKMSQYNIEAAKKYDISNVNIIMKRSYEQITKSRK